VTAPSRASERKDFLKPRAAKNGRFLWHFCFSLVDFPALVGRTNWGVANQKADNPIRNREKEPVL